MYCNKIRYMSYQPPSEKWHLFETVRPSHAKRFVCCALTTRYIIYRMVGQPIAFISNFGGILTSVLHASVNIVYIYTSGVIFPMLEQVVYIAYTPLCEMTNFLRSF